MAAPLGGVLGVALLLAAPVTGAAAPAHPADARDGDARPTSSAIEFSTDGSTWSASPPTAVFPEGIRLVPGDSTTSALHVRNSYSEAAVLVVVISEVDADSPAAARSFRLAGKDEHGEGLPDTPMADFEGCEAVVAPRTLAPGATAEVDLTVELDAATAGLDAQGEGVSFNVWFGLTDALAADLTDRGCPRDGIAVPAEPERPGAGQGGGAGAGTSADPRPSGAAEPSSGAAADTRGLAATGGLVALGAIIVGGAMGGAGWLLMLLARRRRRGA